MSSYDNRQYKLMLERINAFENKKLALKQLIADLEGLLYALQDAPKGWKSSFYEEWAVLEDVYAGVLDEGLKKIPEDSQKLIDGAVGNLKHLVTQNASYDD